MNNNAQPAINHFIFKKVGKTLLHTDLVVWNYCFFSIEINPHLRQNVVVVSPWEFRPSSCWEFFSFRMHVHKSKHTLFLFHCFHCFFLCCWKCIMLALRLNGPVQKTIKKIDLFFVAQFTHPHTRAQHATHKYVCDMRNYFFHTWRRFQFLGNKNLKSFFDAWRSIYARACVCAWINCEFKISKHMCIHVYVCIYLSICFFRNYSSFENEICLRFQKRKTHPAAHTPENGPALHEFSCLVFKCTIAVAWGGLSPNCFLLLWKKKEKTHQKTISSRTGCSTFFSVTSAFHFENQNWQLYISIIYVLLIRNRVITIIRVILYFIIW